VTLAGVTLPQLGGFLKEWRQREPAWTVSGIDLAPQAPGKKGEASSAGGDLPLRAVIGIETMFVEQGGGR
jgi:hypothetical protein